MSEKTEDQAPTVDDQAPPPEPAEAAATAADATPEERIAALEAEVEAMRDRWLRSEADMQNLRARTQREVADARTYAIQRFARDVVEAAENIRRGINTLPLPATDEPEMITKMREGFEETEKSFLSMLERNGITRIGAEGQPFDPELHQAMAQQPAPEGVASGTVIRCWTPAWMLKGRLLKPAMVIVAA